MSMKAAIQKAVKAAFKALGDLNVELTYKSYSGSNVRDIAAGTSVPQVTSYPLKLSVFTKLTEREIDKDGSYYTDSKLLFPRQDLPVASKTSDIVTDGTRTWEVVRNLTEPSASVTSLYVRSTK